MKTAGSATHADLFELYSAIQGEGPYVGLRHLFLRFMGCNLACRYCDTPARHFLKVPARMEHTAGQRDFKKFDNPLGLSDVQNSIRRLVEPQKIHHALSLTGGEPLLYAEFLKSLLPWVRAEFGVRTYLETGGVLDAALREVIDFVDIISMDLKLASATGVPFPQQEHERFLKIALEKEVFVKVVFTQETTRAEIEQAAALVAEVNPRILFVLQPVTPFGPVTESPSPEKTLEFQAIALRTLRDVRVIPQTHKLIGQL